MLSDERVLCVEYSLHFRGELRMFPCYRSQQMDHGVGEIQQECKYLFLSFDLNYRVSLIGELHELFGRPLDYHIAIMIRWKDEWKKKRKK